MITKGWRQIVSAAARKEGMTEPLQKKITRPPAAQRQPCAALRADSRLPDRPIL